MLVRRVGLRGPPAALFIALTTSFTAACVGKVEVPSSFNGEQSGGGGGQATGDRAGLGTAPELWGEQCAGCHGHFPSGSPITTGNANGDFRLDAPGAVARRGGQLEAYIAEAMPQAAPARCEGECAKLTGAHIRAHANPEAASVTCDPDAALGPSYGARQMKLLSSREYQRSLEDLLGLSSDLGVTVAQNDGARGGFTSMNGQGVNGTLMDIYVRNAETIATWAVANGRPFSCSGGGCAERFVTEFLPAIFRGEVSNEQTDAYRALFQAYPDRGLQLALEAALTSPYFLYRIEAGVDLSTALARGYYTHGSEAPVVGPVEGDRETVEARDFRGGGYFDGQVWTFTQNGGAEVAFETAFTSPATLEVEARGSNFDAAWPELTVRVGGELVGVQTVDRTDLGTYRFTVEGKSDSPRVRIEFNNDAGVPPYGPGQDVNLYIANVTLVTSEARAPEPTPEPTPSNENPLEGVDQNAFVLTPYEFASALSFMITGSTPDATLLESARTDRLSSTAQIRAQVVRLLDGPRGREHVANFVKEWFHLDDVAQASRPDVAEFTPEVKAAMVREVQEHFLHIFYNEAVPFSEFYEGTYTFLNQTLARFYGVPGNFSDDFVKTETPDRGGPIASGAFMAANAHAERSAPILRAVHAREDALCHYIDPPNAPIAGENIDDQRAAAQTRVFERQMEEGALSSRDFYFLYTDGIDACAACHEKIINPMFGLEEFDNVGRIRPRSGSSAVMETIEGMEKEVSLVGTLIGVASTSDGNTIEYVGAKDFSNKIARTEAVKACLVRKSFRFLTGLPSSDRDLDTANQETLTQEQRAAYACIASRMTDTLINAGEDPRSMFIELATEALVRLRR